MSHTNKNRFDVLYNFNNYYIMVFCLYTYSENRRATAETLRVVHLTFDVTVYVRINLVVLQPFLVRIVTTSFFGRPTLYAVVGYRYVAGNLHQTVGTFRKLYGRVRVIRDVQRIVKINLEKSILPHCLYIFKVVKRMLHSY